jgi:Methyltransferase domain
VAGAVLLTLPLIERMRRIDGWLTDDEADLLIAGVTCALAALPAPHVIVEVGCYCGRATTVLGGVARAHSRRARVVAIDAHDGVVGALDGTIGRTRPTLPIFRRTIADAGLEDVVEPLQQLPHEVSWAEPIAFLLVDGLHDYASVSRDFSHFEPWLVDNAFVAFHDYADYFPGVVALVDELTATGRYVPAGRAMSMVLLRNAPRASSAT